MYIRDLFCHDNPLFSHVCYILCGSYPYATLTPLQTSHRHPYGRKTSCDGMLSLSTIRAYWQPLINEQLSITIYKVICRDIMNKKTFMLSTQHNKGNRASPYLQR